MNDSTNARLLCIVADDSLKIRDSSFIITITRDSDLGGVIDCVLDVNPSLKGTDHGKFKLYKPPSHFPIRDSHSLHGFQLTQEHLSDPLLVPYRVDKVFQEKDADHRFDIDVIIRLNFGEQDSTLGPFSAKTSNTSYLTYVTLQLRTHREFLLPSEDTLKINNVIKLPNDEDPPEFVQLVEKELGLRRFISCDKVTQPLLGSLKSLLRNGAFGEYFADSRDESEMGLVSTAEILHYLDVLLDQPSKQEAHGQLNMDVLLRRFTTPPFLYDAKFLFNTSWPFSLVVDGDDVPHKYTPHSDFSVIANDFPHLLFTLSSDKSHRGVYHVLLLASCLVRLGNALLVDRSSTFFVKVICIDHDYHAIEYTLYQRGSTLGDDKVEYAQRSFNISDGHDAFTFVFRIYNFLRLMTTLNEKISSRLTPVLSSIMAEVESLPHVAGGHGFDDSCSLKWKTGATLRNPKVQAAIQSDGYTLLSEGSMRLKPTVGKAISNYGHEEAVGLKILDHKDELQILKRLHATPSEANRTIKLLDVIQVFIPPVNILRTVIVMPWQMTLTQWLRENSFRNAVESLRIQFLEGVAFLHEHGVAHMDLKPANLLVDPKRSLSPRLSIIDFGLSVFVESEKTEVTGYRGTPSWVAPEVGTEHGTAQKYSAILADRWSCGQVLLYFVDFLPNGDDSVLGPTSAGLLNLNPIRRPPLTNALQILRKASGEKRSIDKDHASVTQKRPRLSMDW